MLDYLLEEPCERERVFYCPKCDEEVAMTRDFLLWCEDCEYEFDVPARDVDPDEYNEWLEGAYGY